MRGVYRTSLVEDGGSSGFLADKVPGRSSNVPSRYFTCKRQVRACRLDVRRLVGSRRSIELGEPGGQLWWTLLSLTSCSSTQV